MTDYQELMQLQDRRANYVDLDPAFVPLYESCRTQTMTSVERLFDLYKSVQYLVRAGIPGAIVECGVWRGGSMMLAANTLLSLKSADRDLYLYDTFEGHPKGGQSLEHDDDIFGGNGARDWQPDWALATKDEVEANMRSTKYPSERVHLVRGKVEDTLPDSLDVPVAIARLDTDWYPSAKIGLEILWPRISRGGFLIVDDYGHYKGQRKAVDEYFSNQPIKLTRLDYSCRVAQKV